MKYGISLISVIPGRARPSHKSEMVTQLLFGEHYTVVDVEGNWLLIVCAYDGYECWIDQNQHHEISENSFKKLGDCISEVTYRTLSRVENLRTGLVYPILKGSSIPFLQNGEFELDDEKFSFEEEIISHLSEEKAARISDFALSYINSPYLWGGRSPFGIDCSGFAQVVFKFVGIPLLRDANQQAEQGTLVSFVNESKAGDLAFFENEEGKIVHVGIVLDDSMIIHSSGKVKIGRLDHEGIFDLKEKKYTHKLRIIKRYF